LILKTVVLREEEIVAAAQGRRVLGVIHRLLQAPANLEAVRNMNTMMDATLPLTVGEYLEWGNPSEKAAYDYMKPYSPYDNLEKRAYPAILVTTSFNDSQVMYWESAKYVARLRTLKTDTNPLLLKIKMDPAGHGGASGRYDRLHGTAFEYAWLLSQVGITPYGQRTHRMS
jgi:oligopeptidase B